MKTNFPLFCGILIFLVSFNSSAKDTSFASPPYFPVKTKSGVVMGAQKDGVRSFLGIPYATPPVGEHRWKPPQPAEAWAKPLRAIQLGPACYQPQRALEPLPMEMSEDCLSLNVWAKASPKGKAKLPVIVWIHGGGYKRGSGGLFVGNHMAELGHVVVTFNYRLNIFGFLAHEALTKEDSDYPSSGNYGLEDQLLVLKWVQDNIAKFGGDPGNVTLMGESAGGISVCAHLVSPASKGLFHRAILQSGPCDLNLSLKYGEQAGLKIADELGCGDANNTVACLRGKTPDELLTISTHFFPLFDGKLLPDGQTKLLAEGAFAKVPVLLGTNKDEHTRQTLYFGGEAMAQLDEAGYKVIVKNTFTGSNIDAAAVLEQYPASNYPSPAWALAAILGEWQFSCMIRRNARAMAAWTDTYLYRLTYERSTHMGDIGAFHTEDLEFVFFETKRKGFELKEHEKDFSRTMMGYWSRFAKTGNPNGGGAVEWPMYNVAEDKYLDFMDLDKIEVKSGMLPQCDFWDKW